MVWNFMKKLCTEDDKNYKKRRSLTASCPFLSRCGSNSCDTLALEELIRMRTFCHRSLMAEHDSPANMPYLKGAEKVNRKSLKNQ